MKIVFCKINYLVMTLSVFSLVPEIAANNVGAIKGNSSKTTEVTAEIGNGLNVSRPAAEDYCITLIPIEGNSSNETFDLNDSDLGLKNIVVKGKVIDPATGLGIPGVTVLIKGTQKAVSTDFEGTFQIDVDNSNAILIFSFIGYDTIEAAVGNKTLLNISLQPSNTTLSEVIVVGFGKQKKINATGAISTLSGEALTQSPVANISNSLVGRVSGVFATQGGGEPGNDASKIRIRGVGTFTGNTDPLYLVDGMQVDNINNIDPNEIESITVLKDASSTAVYGIRGANGVLIVTTKRGKTGPPKISYTFNIGVNKFTDMREGMNSADYASNFNRALENDSFVTGAVYVPKFTEAQIELYRNGSDPVFYPNKNWPDEMFSKNSTQTRHNLQLSGGSLKTKYLVSLGYFSQEGLFKDTKDIVDAFSPQSTFKRYNLRSNFDFIITDRLKMKIDLSSQTEARTGNNASNTERVIGDIFRASPLSSPGIIDGKIVNLTTVENNPYTSLLLPNNAGGLKRSYRNYFNGLIRFDYDLGFITKGLSAQANIGVRTYNDQTVTNARTLVTYLAVRQTPPATGINFIPSRDEASQFNFAQTRNFYRQITAETALNYSRSFGKHNVKGLLLYNEQKTFDPDLAFDIPKGYQSYVGRAEYNYDSRYLAEFNIGYTGTENFAEDQRFGYFPAFSLGWVVSQESFFPKDAFVSFLKIRGSYGEGGNDNIGGNRFLYRPTSYSTFPNAYYFGNIGSTLATTQGVREGATGNPDVTWERSVKRNIGVELNVLDNKIKFNGDLFDEYRDGILAATQTISSISGLEQPFTNLGIMANKGFEAEISYSDKIGQVGFSISGNYSFARNKILYQDEIPREFDYQRRTGQSTGQFFGLVAEGLFNTWDEVNAPDRPIYSFANNKIQPGDIRYKDVNQDGVIDYDDSVPIGYSRIPESTFGVTLRADYKGFDATVLFQGVGNVSHEYTRFQRSTGFNQTPNEGSASYMNESWTQERYDAGLPINFPRFTTSANPNQEASSFWLADASYIRLKSVDVGYNFKGSFLKKIRITSLRFYVNANNLFTWSKMLPGIDPENVSAVSPNEEPYPLTRTINTGFNINF
ncbi:TonB-dependent receptor [Flavobacterium circumlabens]|uniref:TonB-dependent receptor n=1 Tax=Flavobacterium circumlabens TaxID=2133765 RepID=A0A4Y7UDC7_9FLAO|nr:TonB-dependent receptor [Flavobacterium circumlabens]TCN59041.1 TonB-linked SusC/RagA family outer membrane protein [Flavobacterium circumlabens]TEB44437.1 TonB-dependent receptor [Flavobacterium circumlabens]